MFPKNRMRECVTRLIDRTKENSVLWGRDASLDASDGWHAPRQGNSEATATATAAAFMVRLRRAVVRLQYCDLSDDDRHIVISFYLDDDRLVDQWLIRPDAEDWSLAYSLFVAVDEQVASDCDVILSEIMDYRDEDAEERRRFLELAAGRWKLAFELGGKPRIEELTLDRDGNYFVDKISEKPVFRLADIVYDTEANIVSFSKVNAAGRPNSTPGETAQIEVLRIENEGRRMAGYAQHNGHSLVYERI